MATQFPAVRDLREPIERELVDATTGLPGGTAAFHGRFAGPHPPATWLTTPLFLRQLLYSSNGNPPAFCHPGDRWGSLTMVPPGHLEPTSPSRRDRAQPGARAIDRQAGASLKAKSFTTGFSIPSSWQPAPACCFCTQIIIARLDDDSDGAF